jgi:hypothetical protein
MDGKNDEGYGDIYAFYGDMKIGVRAPSDYRFTVAMFSLCTTGVVLTFVARGQPVYAIAALTVIPIGIATAAIIARYAKTSEDRSNQPSNPRVGAENSRSSGRFAG